MKPGRNDPCPCGSGKKYKKCCQEKPGADLALQPQQVTIPAPVNSRIAKEPAPTERSELVALFNAGHHAELEKRAHLLAEQYPDSGFIWKVLGASLQMQGKDAMPVLQKATELLPSDAEVHYNLGITLQALGQLDGAAASCRRALAIKPDFAEAHYNLGGILKNLMRPDDAAASYRRALEIKPGYAEAHSNLGAVLKSLGQLDDAVASYRRALAIKPDFAEAHYNLGIALQELGQHDDAAASYRRALATKPGYAEAHNNLGNALRDFGQLDDAVASYRRALETKPGYAEAHNNLGVALRSLGQFEGAMESCRRALEINPGYAEAHNNLGNVLMDIGQYDDAASSYRRALSIKPDYALAYNNLGSVLKTLGQPDEAASNYRRALELKPDYAEAHSNLGNALLDLGQFDEAAASYRRALELKPDFANAHSNLLFCLSHIGAVGARELFAEHLRFAERFEAPLRASWPRHANPRDPERRLQIGLVSGDFREHAVAYFIGPVLEQLSGRPGVALHAYSNNAIEDGVTRGLREHVARWDRVVGLPDGELAQKIRADGIDILIDLSGHTGRHRLLAFARKPAPVQASWIGYPGTTGLSAMDYYLADRFFLPPGQLDGLFAEKIVRLPSSVPFRPSAHAPPVGPLPAVGNGHATFGSFNRPSKITRQTVALWSRLLRALPGSRMVLGAMPQDGGGALADWFAREGVARERLSFYPRCGMKEYLELHHRVDICLDTAPYNGGTTTLHALWMGVPPLSLAGDTAASRPGATVLGNTGLEAFLARDAADFVRKGLYWAGDPGALSEIRAGLRVRFEKSAMGRPRVVAAALERALRIMWRRWCAGLPAESFEVSWQDINHG